MKNFRLTGEKIVQIGLFLISVFYLCYSAANYKLGTIQMPKEGFMPLILGIGMTAISAYLMLKAFMNKGDAQDVRFNISWVRFGLIVGVSVLYALTLTTVGYPLGTFIYLFCIFKLAKLAGWVKPAVIAIIVAISFYLIFKTALGVMLPAGFLGL